MWRACAFDDEGNLYAVRAGETLCDFAKIDKTTGAAEVIAANIPPSYYLTTGTIDNDTRRFYYAICMDEGSAMWIHWVMGTGKLSPSRLDAVTTTV